MGNIKWWLIVATPLEDGTSSRKGSMEGIISMTLSRMELDLILLGFQDRKFSGEVT